MPFTSRREFIALRRAAGRLPIVRPPGARRQQASKQPLGLGSWVLRAGSRALLSIVDQVRTILVICLLVTTVPLASAAATSPPRTVLVLDEPDPSSGNPIIFSVTLKATLNTSTPRVAVFGETLNLSRFVGPHQEAILRTYVDQKYRDVNFGVIVAVGASAFDLVRRWRSELWPNVPVVFAAIDELTAADFKLDPETTGLIMRRTISSMMAAAHILVPDLQGVAVLGGLLEKDPYRLQYLRELPGLAAETQLTNLTGLPLAAQMRQASALPKNTAILYTSLFIDNEGTRYSSTEALAEIAKVANRPILIDVENLVGAGATGGFALNNVAYGKEVAALALRILNGGSIAEIQSGLANLPNLYSMGASFNGGVSARAGCRREARYGFALLDHGSNMVSTF